MNNNMDANTQMLRGEMQRVGRCLQAGRMAAPRAGANELRESVDCVGSTVETGEDKIRQETCWGRLVKVTERVTETERETLNGVTETCTRHVKTMETQELKVITETREIEGELDGVKDEHTH